MNRQTLLSIYERLEAVISKLPGPLQNAVIGELKPIKEIFLSQRLARIVLVGKPNADASALLQAAARARALEQEDESSGEHDRHAIARPGRKADWLLEDNP